MGDQPFDTGDYAWCLMLVSDWDTDLIRALRQRQPANFSPEQYPWIRTQQ